MIDGICRRITQKLVEKNIIEFEDHEIYMYGLQLFIATVFKGIGIFTIAYVLGYIKETVAFLAAFSTLRVNAGGYHSSTYFRCFILTVLTMVASIGMATYITLYNTPFITIVMLSISTLLVFKYAPVDTPNKLLSDNESIIYRRRSIVIVVLESLVILVVFIINKELVMYCNIATVAILVESLTLMPFISKSANNRKRYEKKET